MNEEEVSVEDREEFETNDHVVQVEHVELDRFVRPNEKMRQTFNFDSFFTLTKPNETKKCSLNRFARSSFVDND